MKSYSQVTVKLLAIILAVLMSCAFLFTIIQTQADTVGDGAPGASDTAPGASDIAPGVSLKPVCVCTKLCSETEWNTDCPLCVDGFELCAYTAYTVQYFANDSALPADNGNRLRAASPETDAPAFEQECTPNTEYSYPTMDAAGLPEHPGYTFAGWSGSPDAAEAVYKPGEPFVNLTDSVGVTVRLYAVWARAAAYSVTLTSSPNITATFTPANAGTNWTGTITPVQGYKLRANPISVTIDGENKDNETSISCDITTGVITIPGNLVTGDIVITAFAVPISYNVTLLTSANVRDDGENFGTGKAYFDQAWTGSLLMQGYHLDKTDFNRALAIKVNGAPLTGACVEEITDKTTVPSGKGFIYTVDGDIMIAAGSINGNITIQAANAIANRYTIVYDKNAPAATGTMTDEGRDYNAPQTALKANTYVYAGHMFTGWSRSANTSDVAYTDGQSVNNLTAADGEKVTLYAVWQGTGDLPTSIQNGSFEKPKVTIHTMTYQDTNRDIKWKTTLPSHKIEIGNGAHQSAMNTYNLTRAADGTQFAELNADDVGALYQNIATLPGSDLSWGLAHKCRGNNGTVETMQVWIGSETQVDEAIKQYKDAGNRVSGIEPAVLKAVHQRTISDSYTDAVTWSRHTGTYTVPAGQVITKFAFVSVSDINSSYGNLLDDVYFSATPPAPRTEVTVSTTQGGNVTVTYAGNPISGLNSANPSYTGSLVDGGILKLYSGASSGYAYNGAFLDGKYVPKTKLGAMSWTVSKDKCPKNIIVLYSKLRTLTFLPEGGALTQPEVTLGNNTTTHTVTAPSRPGFRFDRWKVVCPDLTEEQISKQPAIVQGDVFQYVTKAGVTSLEIKRSNATILTIPGERGVNLIAIYSEQNTAVTVDPAGGEYAGTADPDKPITGKMSLLNPDWTLASPTRAGYDFAGWKYKSSEGAAPATVYPANTLLTFSVSGTAPKFKVGADAAVNAPVAITFTAQWETRDATAPTITAGTPASVNMVYGDGTQSLTVTTGAVPLKHAYSYQWYKNTVNSNTGGTAVAGATAAGYSIAAKTAVGSSYYYCVVTATRTDTALSKSATSSTATVTVTPKPVTLDWSTDSFAYDGNAKTITAAVNNVLAGDTVGVTAYSGNTKTDAGSYTAAATALSNGNYKLPTSPADRKNWSIGKKTPELTPRVDTMKFTDETITGRHDEISFHYAYDGDGTVTATGTPDIVDITVNTAAKTVVVRLRNPQPSMNGQISVQLVATEGANYTAVTAMPVLLNMQQGQLIGGADGYAGVYDGLPHGIIVKPMFLGYPSEILYGTGEASCTEPSSPTYRDAGTHTVHYKVTIKPIPGLLPNELIIKGTKNVTITPAPLTAEYVSESITFGAVPALRVNVTGFKNSETAAGLPGFAVPTVTNKNTLPGVYTLTPAGGAPTANYTINRYTSGTLTIGPASMVGQVTATGYTGVYDGLEHSITVNAPSGSDVKYGNSADKCTENTPPSHKNVGVYTVYYTASRPGFNDVSGSAAVTITKARLTAEYEGDSIEYTGTPAVLTAAVSGFVGGETATSAAAAGYKAPIIVNNNTLPNVYRLTPQGGSADNYSFNYLSGVLVITAIPMNPIPTAADVSVVYNNQFHGIAVGGAMAGAAVTYGTAADNINLNTTPTYQNAGSYTIHYQVSLPGYEDVTGSARVNIAQRSVSVKGVAVDDKVYDGTTAAKNAVFTLETQAGDSGMLPSDILTADGTVVFSDKNVGINGNAVINRTVSASGIRLSGNDALNYMLDATSITAIGPGAKITPKPVALSWYWGVGGTVDRVYDGKPSNVYAYVSGGLVQGDICNVTTTNGNQASAKTHTATATGVLNPNYRLPATGEPTFDKLSAEYRNTPAKLTAKCHNQTITFTPPGTAPTSFPIEVTGFVNGETPGTIGSTDYTAPTAVTLDPTWNGAGTYKLIVSGGKAKNYTFDYQEGTLTVKEGDLHATVNNYIGDYDGQPHGITIVDDAGITNFKITYYSKDGHQDVDKLDEEPKQTDATTADVPVYYRLTGNSLMDVTGVAYIQINPKQITAELVANTDENKRTKIYNGNTDASANVTVKLNELVSGETPITTGTKIDYGNASVGLNKVVSLTELKLTDNGKFKASNYAVSRNPVSTRLADVGIKPKSVTLKWSGEGDTVYDGKARKVTAKVDSGLVTVGGVTDSCDVSVTGGNKIDVGDHTATATLDNHNYSIPDPSTQGYTITPAPLTAAYVAETITYGSKPALDILVTGFVNGEAPQTAADYVAPTVTLPDGTTETTIPVGVHELVPNGGSATNYTFVTPKKGTLTVNGISMETQVLAFGYLGEYDGQPHGIKVSNPAGSTVTYHKRIAVVKDPVTGEYKDVLGPPLDENGRTITNVKDSPLTVYYRVEMTNHAPVIGSRTVTIEPKPMAAMVENVKPKGFTVYNGSTDATGDIVLRSMTDIDPLTTMSRRARVAIPSTPIAVTATGTIRFTNANAGAAKRVNVTNIAITGEEVPSNYKFAAELLDVTTNAVIEQKPVGLVWHLPEPADMVYDGKVKNVTAAVNTADIVGSDVCTVTVAGGAETNAGSYTATAAALSNSNYKPAGTTTQPYTIAKAVLSEDDIMVSGYQEIYDRKLHDAVILDGIEEGDTVRYSIVGSPDEKTTESSNWLSAMPRIGKRNSKLYIVVWVERPNYEPFITDAVTAHIDYAPEITIEAPQFYPDDPRKVTITGKAENPVPGAFIDCVGFRYRKEGDITYTILEPWETPKGEDVVLFPFEHTFDDLEPDTRYEVAISARNFMEEDAEYVPESEQLVHFRTNPLVAAKGVVSGKVFRETNSQGPIDVTLLEGSGVVASQKGLSHGSVFTLTAIADGEYSLMASDGKYTTTMRVTVKNGRAMQHNIEITLSPKQVKIEGELENNPVTSVDGTKELFNSPEIKNNARVNIALNNGGRAWLTVTFGPGTYDEFVIPEDCKKGVDLSVYLSMTVSLNAVDDMEEDPFLIYSTKGSPLLLTVKLPADAQNKYDYRVFRSHTDDEFEEETVDEIHSFSVSGGYLYLTTDKFSSFMLTYKDKPTGGNGDNDDDDDDSSSSSTSSSASSSLPDVVPGIVTPDSGSSGSDSGSSDSGGGSSGSGSGEENPVKPEKDPLDDKKEELKKELEEKLKEIIAGLPDSLTPEQREAIVAELNRIYSEGIAGIDRGTTLGEITAAYDEAVRALGAVSFGSSGQRPFVLFSALFALGAVVFAEVTFFRKRGKKRLTAAIFFALLAVLVLILTSGTGDIILANGYTPLVAVLCASAAAAALYRPSREKQKKQA